MTSAPMQNPKDHFPSTATERRRFTRFAPKNGTMAINNHTLGPIVNISMGGLSFQCMDDEHNVFASNLFGIFLSSDDLLIDKIQSQIVSNKLKRSKNAFMQTRTRQLSICFLDLNPEQQKKLKDFILTKTRGVV